MAEQDVLDAAIDTFLAADGATPAETSDSDVAAPESTDVELAASDAPTTEDPAVEATEEPKPAQVRSPKFQKLLDKYQGDEDKFAEAIFENYNSMSALRKELDDVKSTLTQSSPKAIQAVIDNDPDVQWISGELSTLTTNLKQNEAARVNLLDKIDKTRSTIAKLEGKLEVADEFEKPILEREKFLSDKALEDHLAQWRGLDRDDASIQREKREFERKFSQAQREAESKVAVSKQRDADFESSKEKHFNDFVSAVDASAKEYRLDSKQKAHLTSVLRAEAYMQISSLPESHTQGIDIAAFVRERSKVYADVLGIRRATLLASKTSIGSPTNGKSTPAEVLSKSVAREALIRKMPKTAQEARDRARAILG